MLEPASIPTSAHHVVSAFASYAARWLDHATSLQVNVDNLIYAGLASFTRYIARHHGFRPLLRAIADFDHEAEGLPIARGRAR